MLKVHVLQALTPENLAEFHRQVSAEVQLTAGLDLPVPAEYEILVASQPKRIHVEASPRLRAVIIPHTGVAEDVQKLMAEFPEVAVHNAHHPGVPTAEMAVALLMAAARRLVPADRAFRDADWNGSGRPEQAVLLEGKTVLILGYGEIGQRVARVCQALGMRVVVTRRSLATPLMGEVEIHPAAHLAQLLPRAQVLMITLPLTPSTRGLIGAAELALLPPGAILVNVGRGPVVDEAALYAALHDGPLSAAGLDVWYNYPPDEAARSHTRPSAYPFHELDNVVLSPHRGGLTAESERRGLVQIAHMLNAAARGEPMPNRVDVEVGY